MIKNSSRFWHHQSRAAPRRGKLCPRQGVEGKLLARHEPLIARMFN